MKISDLILTIITIGGAISGVILWIIKYWNNQKIKAVEKSVGATRLKKIEESITSLHDKFDEVQRTTGDNSKDIEELKADLKDLMWKIREAFLRISKHFLFNKNKQTFMKQETAYSLIRSVMTLVGAFLLGGGVKKFFGVEINTAYWEQIIGVVLTLTGIVWSIVTKSVDIEKLEGGIRQVSTFVIAILTTTNILTPALGTAVMVFIVSMFPFLQGLIAKKKAEQLQKGNISAMHLVTKDTKNKK